MGIVNIFVREIGAVAIELNRNGSRLVAVCDSRAAIGSPDGMDVEQLIKHKANTESAGRIWRVFRPIPLGFLKMLAFLSPSFIFVLAKPGRP